MSIKSYKPPIVVVAYNRSKPLKRLLKSLNEAIYPSDDIELIISIDHHNDNADVIKTAEDFAWAHGNKKINDHPENLGLKKHVLECGDYSYQYGGVIVLEDDLVVAKDFYLYTIAALEKYQDDEKIAGISLYCNEWNSFSKNVFKPIITKYSTYFRQTCESWGQSWSKEQWDGFKCWLKENPEIPLSNKMPEEVYYWPKTSWGKLFNAYVVEKDLYLVVPYVARSTCFSEAGVHTANKNVSNQVSMQSDVPPSYFFPSFEEGVHYDLFFENIDLKEHLSRWIDGPCCIDLYGTHFDVSERYILSTRILPYKIVRSFALEMRPPEQNVICDLEGSGIFLYDRSVRANNRERCFGMDAYDLSGYPIRRVISYAAQYIRNKLRVKFGMK